MWNLSGMKKGLDKSVEFMKKEFLHKADESRIIPSSYVTYTMSDEEDESVFVMNTDSATVGDVLAAFPLGSAHIRFKVSDDQFGHVWQDPGNHSERAPKFGQNIVLRVMTVPYELRSKAVMAARIIKPVVAPNREELVKARLEAEAAQVKKARDFAAASAAGESIRRDKKSEIQNEIGSVLDSWALTEQGKLKDVRTLLSTMDSVLWSKSGWESVALSELMMNESVVKKVYRKAILVCHPDKHQDKCVEEQYRADRIFNAINESYKVFGRPI